MNVGDRLGCRAFSERDVERVDEHDLSAGFDEVVAEYESLVGDRDRFLWKWLDLLVPETTLSCVDDDHRESAVRAKLFASMFVVLLDDLAEKRRDRTTFELASKVPFERTTDRPDGPDIDATCLRFADRIWTRFESELSDAPRVDEFRDVLSFDVRQNLNAIEYSLLANANPDLVNLAEATRYEEHNMMLLTHADVDLAFSTAFDRAELADLRRIVTEAQEVTRIGNWIATWEREVAEGDFTSGVLAYALESDIVSPADLEAVRAGRNGRDHEWLIETIREHDVESRLVERYGAIRAMDTGCESRLDSVDVAAYLDGIEQVMGYYLGTKRRL